MNSSHRSELVSLLRGFFACPVLTAFAETGLSERLRNGVCKVDDLQIVNCRATQASLAYLVSLGVIDAVGEGFRLSSLGEYLFDRVGVFQLMRSYRDYFADFSAILLNDESEVAVKRLENVAGTGQIHAKKYFPIAINRILQGRFETVLDLGCGNGDFLADVLAQLVKGQVIGVDLSADAVQATEECLTNAGYASRSRQLVANANQVEDWAPLLPLSGRASVVTAWFVLHEFANGVAEPIVRFFNDLYSHTPEAEVIIGEVVAHSPQELAANRSESIYPELLLFHALSGQGILSWSEHQKWISQVPYEVVFEEQFDVVQSGHGKSPSTVIWHLKPRR